MSIKAPRRYPQRRSVSHSLCPDPALRPLSDIDLLIPRQHLDPAVQAVKSLDYREPYPEMAPDLNRAIHYHVHLRLQHGATQARLIWYYDLHLLVTREAGRLDWGELLVRAREFRWAAALHAALLGTQDRFGTPLPAGFLDALAETQDRQAARSVERKACPIQTRAVRTWDGLEAQSWRGRLRLAWAIACPSPEYVRWRYRPRPVLRALLSLTKDHVEGPAWLLPLYYPFRWFDILRDGLLTLWQIGKRD